MHTRKKISSRWCACDRESVCVSSDSSPLFCLAWSQAGERESFIVLNNLLCYHFHPSRASLWEKWSEMQLDQLCLIYSAASRSCKHVHLLMYCCKKTRFFSSPRKKSSARKIPPVLALFAIVIHGADKYGRRVKGNEFLVVMELITP